MLRQLETNAVVNMLAYQHNVATEVDKKHCQNRTQSCCSPVSVCQRGEGAAVSSHSLFAGTMARFETTASRPYHLVIFGASGFTGQFVVEEVARTVSEGPKGTLKWAVAGRSKQKLEKVLEQAAGVLGMYLNKLISNGC